MDFKKWLRGINQQKLILDGAEALMKFMNDGNKRTFHYPEREKRNIAITFLVI